MKNSNHTFLENKKTYDPCFEKRSFMASVGSEVLGRLCGRADCPLPESLEAVEYNDE